QRFLIIWWRCGRCRARPNANYLEEPMTSLLTRLLRRSPRAEHLTLTVYTRAQCCCCHKALDVLKDAQQRSGFGIEEVDIDADPNLITLYDTEVPVVALNGKVRFRGVVNPALLERLLVAESAKQSDDKLQLEGN
ncbi:MAG TPA: glutaredoxin family protein, partial [Isosphaeraceae bacterium]|nr:glutaredoxin family protein [Isosphaeraceae bacterium]